MDSIEIVDDTDNSFIRSAPVILEQAFASNGYTEKPLIRSVESDTPHYDIKIRPSGSKTRYIKRNYKIDFLFGVFGGVFLFWYFIIHFFGKAYNSFKTRQRVAEVIYDDESTR